jgi:hypothetical protein
VKVTLNLSNELLKAVLATMSDEDHFDSQVELLLSEALKSLKFLDIDVEYTVQLALSETLGHADLECKLTMQGIYKQLLGINPTRLNPNDRKSLGRRFKRAIELHANSAQSGERIIVNVGRTQQHAQLYTVILKE